MVGKPGAIHMSEIPRFSWAKYRNPETGTQFGAINIAEAGVHLCVQAKRFSTTAYSSSAAKVNHSRLLLNTALPEKWTHASPISEWAGRMDSAQNSRL